MSKIGDFKFIKTDKNPLKKLTKKPVITTDKIEQFTIVTEDKSSITIGQVLGQAKDEVIKPLDEFVKEHPSLELFVPALIAGGVAGWLDKKLEEKQIMTDYLKKLDKFTNKVERQVKYYNMIDEAASIVSYGFHSVFPGSHSKSITKNIVLLGALGLTAATAVIGSLACKAGQQAWQLCYLASATTGMIALTSLLHKDKLISKDNKCIMTKHHEFVTVPPSGDKLIYYKVVKGEKGNLFVPTKTVNLKHKATTLSLDKANKNSFYVNYEDGAKRAEFFI